MFTVPVNDTKSGKPLYYKKTMIILLFRHKRIVFG
ncbi:MAG: hypothetical protein UZ08_BCD001002723 [Candidatus Parvibacillus calidus]|nr:MAG: hypothetical protein UZ08_BCD001002723 [Candidatus Parvibacillus calidus]